MAILISSSKNKKVFNKQLITIGSAPDCDFVADIGKEPLILQYSQKHNKYIIANKNDNPRIMFRGIQFAGAMIVENVLKLTVANSDEFIVIKAVELRQEKSSHQNIAANPGQANLPQQGTNIKQTGQNSQGEQRTVSKKEILEKQKAELEAERSAIIKQVGFAINDINKRLDINTKSANFSHIAMFAASFISAFGLSNYLTGLKAENMQNFIQMPTNIKIYILFGIIVTALSFALKQGVFLYYQNKSHPAKATLHAQGGLIMGSCIFFAAIYVINLLYYTNVNPAFGILISLFFVGLNIILSYTSGYFKFIGHSMGYALDEYEYREDFEKVINTYRSWIEKYINNLSNTKIRNIKDKLFNLQLKSAGEILLGILTAPFLAYGVSNTLAQCFPEAAGWIRISGLRFSPVFLILATFLIIFAFFTFTMAFTCTRKIQGSNVIKNDGFNNYLTHGVNILGVQGVRKLNNDKSKALIIACSIILIEFSMNTSFFFSEIGGDLQGVLLSIIAALVPTALLIAETFMLSSTRFEIYACESLIAMLDRE